MKKVLISYRGGKVLSFKGKRLGVRPVEIGIYSETELKKAVYNGIVLKKSCASEAEIFQIKSIPGVVVKYKEGEAPKPVKLEPVAAPIPSEDVIEEEVQEKVDESTENGSEEVEKVSERKFTEEEVMDMGKADLMDHMDAVGIKYKKSMKLGDMRDLVLSTQ